MKLLDPEENDGISCADPAPTNRKLEVQNRVDALATLGKPQQNADGPNSGICFETGSCSERIGRCREVAQNKAV